jgi:oligoribonuclease
VPPPGPATSDIAAVAVELGDEAATPEIIDSAAEGPNR